MANIKKIKRDEQIRVRLSKEEKELIEALAKDIGIKPTRLVRDLTISTILESYSSDDTLLQYIEEYIFYLAITNNDNFFVSFDDIEEKFLT